jgi:DNA-binding transcriptional LysR family regulator
MRRLLRPSSGETDLAIGLFDQLMPELEKLSLVAPKLRVIVPHNHPLAVKRGIVMNDLAEHHLVLLQPGTRPERLSMVPFILRL